MDLQVADTHADDLLAQAVVGHEADQGVGGQISDQGTEHAHHHRNQKSLAESVVGQIVVPRAPGPGHGGRQTGVEGDDEGDKDKFGLGSQTDRRDRLVTDDGPHGAYHHHVHHGGQAG